MALDWGELSLATTIELLIRRRAALAPFQRPLPDPGSTSMRATAERLGLAAKAAVPSAASMKTSTKVVSTEIAAIMEALDQTCPPR